MFWYDVGMKKLLTRDQFREGVHERDGQKCVICGRERSEHHLDAHHILERRLWDNGGYYLDNGATLCEEHHLAAEATTLSCEEIRKAAGIEKIALPPHLYPDMRWDKWGNRIMEEGEHKGKRLSGELAFDESVLKITQPVRDQFLPYGQFPRTYHLPWSQTVTKDDRVHSDNAFPQLYGQEVVVTEKLDGQLTQLTSDSVFGRGPDDSRPSSYAKSVGAGIGAELPRGWRVCAEDLLYPKTVQYGSDVPKLAAHSLWNDRMECLGWDESQEWFQLLGLPAPRVLWRGEFNDSFEEVHKSVVGSLETNSEGYVLRLADAFPLRHYRHCVGKWVRAGFVHKH